MNEELKELKKAATRGRGKVTKERQSRWIDAFSEAIRTDPAGTVLMEASDGRPHPKKRPATKSNGWLFELINDKTNEWEWSTVLNLDKAAGAIRLSHSLQWCMAKLKKEKELFTRGTFDKCKARLHNVVTDDIIMLAVLV